MRLPLVAFAAIITLARAETCEEAYTALWEDGNLTSAREAYRANYAMVIADYDPENDCGGDKYEDLQFECDFPDVDGVAEVQAACEAIEGATFIVGEPALRCIVAEDDWVRERVVNVNFPDALDCVPAKCTDEDIAARKDEAEETAEELMDDLFPSGVVDCDADIKPESGASAGMLVGYFLTGAVAMGALFAWI
jgi:hypothetical protein